MPVDNESDRAIAMGYLRGLGIQQVAGMSVPVPATTSPVQSVASAIACAEATRARGEVIEQSFDNDTSSNGLAVGGKVLGKFGGSGEVKTMNRTSTGASYFDGATWRPWQACG